MRTGTMAIARGARGILAGRPRLGSALGVAVFVAMLLALRQGLNTLVDHALHGGVHFLKGEIPPGPALLLKTIQAALILGATAVMARIEGRSLDDYGLGGPRRAARLAGGFAAGALCMSLIVGLLAVAGFMSFDGPALHGPTRILVYGVSWMAVFFAVGLGEEALFRGYLQAALSRIVGVWPAAFILSAAFAATHIPNPGESTGGLIGVLLGGLMFCLLLKTTGSLWLGIGFHAAWDWAQSFVYGTPDSGNIMEGRLMVARALGDPTLSGGSAGPEASLLALPVTIIFVFCLIWRLRGRGSLAV